MKVNSVKLQNFRNYESLECKFSSTINILVGDNAQGKTNLLESVYLCGIGRSPRTPRDKELIRSGESRAKVVVEVEDKSGTNSVEIIIDKADNKRVAINGLPITRMGELMGVVAIVFFSPDEMKIVKDSPGDRRRFMDIALCQISKAYFYLLNRYNKILSQRNKLLKSGRATPDTLDVWDSQLITEGSKIIKTRRGFVVRLTAFAAANHLFLTDGKENLVLEYEGIAGETLAEIQENFSAVISGARQKDMQLGYTGYGPQKDDINVLINNIDARSYGSQGQQRTAALSLKLAELDIHHSETGTKPILLLDDVLSELDYNRQIALLKKVQAYQTIITCTHLEDKLKSELKTFAKFTITNGTVIKE